MRTINIKQLKIFANHGVNDSEKQTGQNFYIDAHLFIKNSFLKESDNIDNTVNYSTVCKHIIKIVSENTWDLIETVAENIASSLLLKFCDLDAVEVEVFKPEAPMKCDFENVSVKVFRKWHNVAVSLGSNLGNKEKYLACAIEELKSNYAISHVKASKLIKTKPYGYVDQDDFLNGAAIFKTFYTPEELLNLVNCIEIKNGRKRSIHWGPRTLDLDIIFYDNQVIHLDNLIIPHYDLENRYFVLKPLDELIPNFIHPYLNKSIHQMLEDLNDKN